MAAATSAPAAAPAAAPKRGRKMMLIAVALVAVAAGVGFPLLVNVPALFAKPKSKGTVIVPFGDITVNLSEERMTRYLRIKIAVVVEADAEKEMTETLTKHKAAIKSKLIGHLAGKSVKDVSGSAGVTRTQRELLEKFEDVLHKEGHKHVQTVLFEEYIVQ